MAEIGLQPPDPFNFKVPDDWPWWRHCFEQFRVASGLQDASALKQVNTLLYCLGEEAESMLKSTNITEEETKNYKTVLEKFASKKKCYFREGMFQLPVSAPRRVGGTVHCRVIQSG